MKHGRINYTLERGDGKAEKSAQKRRNSEDIWFSRSDDPVEAENLESSFEVSLGRGIPGGGGYFRKKPSQTV